MSLPLYFRCVDDGSVLVVEVVRPVGSLAEEAVMQELDGIVAALAQRTTCKVLIDFKQTAYFGSSLLEGLRLIWTKVEEREGRMVLCNLSPVGKEIVQLAKFDTLWPICETRAEALALLK